MEKSLSPEEVKNIYNRLCGKNIQVVMYDKIIELSDLNQLFTDNNCVIIFYPYAQVDNVTMGHYTCLIKDVNNHTYYYYDPLAYKPDEYKQFAPQRYDLYRENQNTLISLLLEQMEKGYNIDYNNFQHQSRKPTMATCGRHCAFRCVFSDLSNNDYNKLLNKLEAKFKLDKNTKLKDKLIYFLTN